jgi:hypothetical protein
VFVEDSWQALVGLRLSPGYFHSIRRIDTQLAAAGFRPTRRWRFQDVAPGDIRPARHSAMTDANEHDQEFVNSYPSDTLICLICGREAVAYPEGFFHADERVDQDHAPVVSETSPQ